MALQLKMKELDVAAATAMACHTDFDVSKRMSFVSPFQEIEVDKRFLHFESVWHGPKRYGYSYFKVLY